MYQRCPPTWLRLARIFAGLAACTSALHAAPPSPDYKLVLEDAFDGTDVDTNLWDYRLGRRGGEDPAAGWIFALNRRGNVTVSDGMMRIRHAQETIGGNLENTCGGLITKSRFGYGYFECRYKPLMIASPGTHGAFWMRGINRGNGAGEDPTRPVKNAIFEIDSSEISSPHWIGTNNLYITIKPKEGPSNHWPHRVSIPIEPDAEGFVVDAFEYRPDGIIFYDNGREVSRTTFTRFQGPQEIWLTSLAGAHHRQMDASLLPGDALFDYFRYYARDWPGANLLANGGFEYNLDSIDPQHPVGWCESGDAKASSVSTGAAQRDQAFLRHASAVDYNVTTSQTLQHILDGTFDASAWVRSSGGQRSARLEVRSPGGTVRSVALPEATEWTRVELTGIEVAGNSVTLSLTSEATGGQWLEVDDVRLMKPPLPGQSAVEPPPFPATDDPPFHLYPGTLQSFEDRRNALFPRETGSGPAISVSFALRSNRLAAQTPVEKAPASGTSGWSIQLRKNGDLAFLIGSTADRTEVVARSAYQAGKVVDVACVFDRGEAVVYIDGREAARKGGIVQTTDDLKTPGSIGRNWARGHQGAAFDGALGDIRVFNRALTQTEVARLNSRPVAE